MLDSKNINIVMSANISVYEIKKAVVDMNAAGVEPGTADRQMASFRQLFVGFNLTPSPLSRYAAVLPAAFSINNKLF